MKLLKWILIFVFAFIVSFLLLRTFSQEVFKATASAHIFGYITPEIPIYNYIAGSFGLGLSLGILIALYNFITSSMEIHAKSKQIRKLENECESLLAKVASHTKDTLSDDSSPLGEEYADYDDKPEDKSPHKDSSPDNAADSFIG